MKKVKRLFDEFKPDHYELVLEPDRETMTFCGTVKITGQKTSAPSNRITFHQKDLKIKSATVARLGKKQDRQEFEIDRINLQRSFDEARIHTKGTLFPGRYEITISFSGRISEQMNGIYVCNFTHDGQAKKLIATQFESHYARQAFPCIDEPEAKATFDLSLTTPAGETAIANTPVKSQTDEDGKLHTAFETTPRMSTYLLAFAFGEIGYREGKTKRGVTVRTYATPDNARYTDFALDTAIKCLDFYEGYFEIDYPLPKLDMIALPDFSSGAMENWGLVTYREQAMLVDPKNTGVEMKQYVAMVIAHELAHQWFGNLVTMRWWTDLWLNEGFASWIEYLAVNELYPGWNMWTQYIVEDQFLGLRSDALASTHPVEVEVNHPDEIRTIFDDISYQKGSAVIHMLQAYLGAEVFRHGLQHYLKKYAYKNAVTEDLWAALEEVSGKPVRNFMHAWVGKPGYPLLKVSHDDDSLSLAQERFFALHDKHTSDTAWPIPLNTPGLEFADTLSSRTMTIDWVGDIPLFNQGHSGFYATVYDADTYARFGQAIEAGSMIETDRLGLLNDAFSAARAGYLPTNMVLPLLIYFHGEHSAPVWDTLAIILADIRRVFDDDELQDLIKPYLLKITGEQAKRLGWQPKAHESHFDALLRPTVLGLASWAGNKSVVDEALARFKAMKQPEDEHPDLRPVIYYSAVRNGGQAVFNKLKRFYETTESASEKVTLAGALTSFKQPEIYRQGLSLIKTKLVRSQDIGYWVSYSFSNRHAKREAWAWLQRNWKWLEKNLGSELGFARLQAYAARAFSDSDFRAEFVDFFKPRLTPSIEREYKKALETIDWQTAWRQRDMDAIKNFFANF